jgi:hypothetical protein
MRALGICLLGLILACCGPSAAVAKNQKKLSKCQKLRKHHKDLATSRKLVAVVTGNDETGDISACVLPRGRIRTLASWDDGLDREFGALVDTAGTWALYDEGYNDQYGGEGRTLTRIDVRHNKRLLMSSYSCNTTNGPTDRCTEGTTYGLADITSNGAGAFELVDYAAGTTSLQAFDPAGAFTKLADGPVVSLHVSRMQISWAQAGSPHVVPLPE